MFSPDYDDECELYIHGEFRNKVERQYSESLPPIHFRFPSINKPFQIPAETVNTCLAECGLTREACVYRSFSVRQVETLLTVGTDRDETSWLNMGDEALVRKHAYLTSIRQRISYISSPVGEIKEWIDGAVAFAFWHKEAVVKVPYSTYGLFAFCQGGAKNGLAAVFSDCGNTPMPRDKRAYIPSPWSLMRLEK